MTENGTAEPIIEAKLQQMEQGSSGATKNQKVYEENLDKLDKLLADGHKLMLAQSFDDASVVFCKAVELASNCFEDFAPQSFLPHFNYGQALIEVARLESLLVKPSVEDTDESDRENGAQKEDHLKETEEQKGKEKTEEKGGEERTDRPQMEESDGQQNNPREEKADNGREEGLEDECGEDGEKDDIQIAWENLEVARKICEIQMKDDDQKKLWLGRKADVLVALGECMTVSENFPLALDEFTKALNIRKELFGDAGCRVAEVHIWIGRTHKLMNDFKNAAEHFGNAKKMLEAVIAAKETELREGDEETRENLSQELEELKDAIKGVQENVQDAGAQRGQLLGANRPFRVRVMRTLFGFGIVAMSAGIVSATFGQEAGDAEAQKIADAACANTTNATNTANITSSTPAPAGPCAAPTEAPASAVWTWVPRICMGVAALAAMGAYVLWRNRKDRQPAKNVDAEKGPTKRKGVKKEQKAPTLLPPQKKVGPNWPSSAHSSSGAAQPQRWQAADSTAVVKCAGTIVAQGMEGDAQGRSGNGISQTQRQSGTPATQSGSRFGALMSKIRTGSIFGSLQQKQQQPDVGGLFGQQTGKNLLQKPAQRSPNSAQQMDLINSDFCFEVDKTAISTRMGKSIDEVISAGQQKLATMPTGGGGAAPATTAASSASPAAKEEKKEEKKKEEVKEESDDDMGFGLFD